MCQVWKLNARIVDMSTPVHRHLAEQKWRKEGGLDLLVSQFIVTALFTELTRYIF